jgi:hypothetical protein
MHPFTLFIHYFAIYFKAFCGKTNTSNASFFMVDFFIKKYFQLKTMFKQSKHSFWYKVACSI